MPKPFVFDPVIAIIYHDENSKYVATSKDGKTVFTDTKSEADHFRNISDAGDKLVTLHNSGIKGLSAYWVNIKEELCKVVDPL